MLSTVKMLLFFFWNKLTRLLTMSLTVGPVVTDMVVVDNDSCLRQSLNPPPCFLKKRLWRHGIPENEASRSSRDRNGLSSLFQRGASWLPVARFARPIGLVWEPVHWENFACSGQRAGSCGLRLRYAASLLGCYAVRMHRCPHFCQDIGCYINPCIYVNEFLLFYWCTLLFAFCSWLKVGNVIWLRLG